VVAPMLRRAPRGRIQPIQELSNSTEESHLLGLMWSEQLCLAPAFSCRTSDNGERSEHP